MRWWWLLCVGCAHRIAAVDAAPAAPSAGVPVQTCWIEYGRGGPFTASGLAIHTADGIVLVDAGQSHAFGDELGEVASGRFYLRLVPGQLTPKDPASEVLAAANVDVNNVIAMVPTHAHSDHVGGLMDLPDMPVFLHPAERALFEAGAAPAFNVLPAHARRIRPLIEDLVFLDRSLLGFTQSVDLLADGSVVIVPLSGHTPGSVGVLVDTGAVRVLLAGDAVNARSQLTGLRGKGLLLRRTDADGPAADAQVAVLAAVHGVDGVTVLPAHERRAWVDLFSEPGGCIGGP